MSTIIKIFKNLGKIVILLFQIVYVSIVDYLSTFDNSSPHKDKDTKNKTVTKKDVCWDSSYSMENEEQESLKRSYRMVEWSENPHYED